MKTIRFGIIGCGLMGREFASATARWCHMMDASLKPVVTAISNRSLNPARIGWFTENFPTIAQVTDDYQALLANDEVDAVYVAVPHNQHEAIYTAALAAGKHLLGEKPFGLDLAASTVIRQRVQEHPHCHTGCASQLIFFPGAQRILNMLEEGCFGRIIEVDAGFLHCSDLDPEKPFNWKRSPEINGEYGPLADLGAHIALVPFRAGWQVQDTRAICTNIITERPDGQGGRVPCDLWDNATLLSTVKDPRTGDCFPWTLRAHRILPGEMNTWYLNVYGTQASARYSLRNPKALELLVYEGGSNQTWQTVELGYETPYPTITGRNFEFGATDAILQLIASFLYECEHGKPLSHPAACPTAEEMFQCHRLFDAAMESQRTSQTVSLTC